jgi:tetratricopeptide (TPR) repeat protein
VLEAPARRFLALAGERALGLDTQTALHSFERALALTPPSHPDRPAALVRFGEAAFHAGRNPDAAAALDEAIRAFKERNDVPATAHSLQALGNVCFRVGDPRWAELPAEALALLEPLPPGPPLVRALTEVARMEFLRGRLHAALSCAERALTLADELGLERSPRTLGYRGFTRGSLGDPGGLDDMRDAIPLATRAGQGREVGVIHNNLGIALWVHEGPKAALEELRTGTAFANARGLTEIEDLATLSTFDPLIDIGRLDEALDVAARIAKRLEVEARGDLVDVRAARARIHTLRGDAGRVAEWLEWIEATAREYENGDTLVIGPGAVAMTHAALGHNDKAAAMLEELAAAPSARASEYYAVYLPGLVRTAITIRDQALAQRLVADLEPRTPYARHTLTTITAILAEAHGDMQTASDGYADAAGRWEGFGVIPEQAYALQGHGRCLLRLGRSSEAVPVLRHARDLFQQLGAMPALAETDALLEAATALSS